MVHQQGCIPDRDLYDGACGNQSAIGRNSSSLCPVGIVVGWYVGLSEPQTHLSQSCKIRICHLQSDMVRMGYFEVIKLEGP